MPDQTFDQWMRAVDRAVIATVGLSVHDIADQPFRDWYDDETPASEAAESALVDAGWEQ